MPVYSSTFPQQPATLAGSVLAHQQVPSFFVLGVFGIFAVGERIMSDWLWVAARGRM